MPVPDPAWKSGPPEPKYTHSDHDIWPEDFGHNSDIDGFGKKEAEEVQGEALITIREAATCGREGCDARHEKNYLFTTHTLTDEEVATLKKVSEPDVMAAYVWNNCERVDVETIEVDMPTSEDNLFITAERIVEDEPPSTCHGRPEPPSYEPHGL